MKARGLIFDYGGTIDTDSVHWSHVLWDGYVAQELGATDYEAFRQAYVHGERTLARQPLIRPEHNMLELLRIKVGIELAWLCDNGYWTASREQQDAKAEAIARHCYDHVLDVLTASRAVLQRLAAHYPMVLVSNFYGNIGTILSDFRLDMFQTVVESAVVGIRKPDPRIFQLGVDALGLPAGETVVVGDSFSKDIVPAASLGCQTVWIRGRGWGEETVDESIPTHIITSITQLPPLLEI